MRTEEVETVDEAAAAATISPATGLFAGAFLAGLFAAAFFFGVGALEGVFSLAIRFHFLLTIGIRQSKAMNARPPYSYYNARLAMRGDGSILANEKKISKHVLRLI